MPKKQKRRLTIGTFFMMLNGAAFELQLGVARFAQEHGGINVRRFDFLQWPRPANLKEWGLDGIVIQLLPHFKRMSLPTGRIPMVNVSNQTRQSPVPRVCAPDESIGRAVADYFVRRGFRSFAFCGQSWYHASRLRFKGFCLPLERAGFKVHRFDLRSPPDDITPYTRLNEYRRLIQWLRTLPRPCALMNFNDDVAAMIIRHAPIAGRGVPQDLAVMGVDNFAFRAALSPVSLSSVDVGYANIGYEATAALVHHIEDLTVPIPDQTVRGFKIVTRRSTDLRAVDDDVVNTALDFIEDNPGTDVQGIVRSIAISRRVLERRFREKAGFTVHTAIQNSRLEKAKNLLLATNLPIKDIANVAGFRSSYHFHVVFKAREAVTPSRFRQSHHGHQSDRSKLAN